MPVLPPFQPSPLNPNYWTISLLVFDRSAAFPDNPEFVDPFPNDIQVYDINGDGHLDVVTIYSFIPGRDLPGIPIRVLLGDGAGGFVDGTNALFGGNVPLGDAASGVVVADFNGDGVDDLFISQSGERLAGLQNGLILSNGAGGVVDVSATNLPQILDFTHWSTGGDIDGDGDIDLYVGNLGVNERAPYFLINDGTGMFTRSDTRLPAQIESGAAEYTSCLLFDADSDGDLDLMLGMWGPQAAFVGSSAFDSLILFNDGAGNFSQTANSTLPDSMFPDNRAEVLDVEAIDLNGDGHLDLMMLVHNGYAETSERYIQVLINNGSGGFIDQTPQRLDAYQVSAQYQGRYMHLVDINGDGDADLVLQTGGATRFYLNEGAGTFVALPADFLFTNGGSYAFVPGDFNEDGLLDFYVRTITNSWDDPAHVTEFAWIATWTPLSSTNVSGDDNGNALLGGAAAEALRGLGGDDVIFGGAGDDYLDGGAGVDALNGGDGDDIIVYDADDDATHVHGGAGFDLLVFSGGAAPTSFDLIAQGFEGAEARFIDVGNVEAWATQTLRYDHLWHLDRETIGYDDNSRVVLDYDEQSVETWSLKWTRFDTLGRVDLEVLTFDDGARANLDYDQGSASPWTTMWSLYDASDNLLAEAIDYDDGARITLAHDTVDAFDWSENWVSYDALDRVDAEAIDYDDGSRITQNYDQDNSQAWTTDWVRYDALDRVDVQVITYDDGTYAVQDFDQADEHSWLSQWWLYDANDNLIAFQGINDDGSPFG